MSDLQISLLGAYEVRRQGKLLDLHQRRADALFACLSIFGNWVDKATLTSLLWPESVGNPIDQACRVLREELGSEEERLETRRGRLRLNLEGVACDLARFDQGIRQRANETVLRDALSAYGGKLLPHWEEDAEMNFREWLLAERSRRETWFCEGIERAAGLACERNAPDEALMLLRQYVLEMPRRDHAWLMYLRLAEDTGNRLEGIDAFERYRERLHEHQLSPNPAMQEIYRRLLDGGHSKVTEKETPGISPSGAMASSDPRYIVREVDRELEHALERRDTFLILVKGSRETGKSSLVVRHLELASRRHGTRTFHTDFKAFPRSAFDSIESLCQALVSQLSDQLCKPRNAAAAALEDERLRKVPTLGLESFVQRWILQESPESALLWALDGVDRLFGCDAGHDFFSLVRSWHDKRAQLNFRAWRRLKILLVGSTEATLFLRNAHHSPFNVGLPIELSDFTEEETLALYRGSGIGGVLEEEEVRRLYALLGGHPYLMSYAMESARAGASATALLSMEPYRDYLNGLREIVEANQNLRESVADVLAGRPCREESFYRLRSAGVLIGRSSGEAKMRCRLIAEIFQQ